MQSGKRAVVRRLGSALPAAHALAQAHARGTEVEDDQEVSGATGQRENEERLGSNSEMAEPNPLDTDRQICFGRPGLTRHFETTSAKRYAPRGVGS